jgi:two-component system nitrogen regulation response regulator GlnG
MRDGASSGDSTLNGQPDASGRTAHLRDLALTILCHADVRRIGDRARLFPIGSKGRIAIHRGAPSFAPASGEAAPLADRFLSRHPIEIVGDGKGTVRIMPHPEGSRLVLDEVPVVEACAIPAAALEVGIVLELAERVALLLHTLGPSLQPRPRMGMIGESEIMEDLRGRVMQVAPLAAPVLIRGETGVGKELVATAIHAQSRHASGPFVCINSASLSPATAISELFGHRRGAFTDARADHDGVFARAHGGTLFLDEIGELPGAVQPMLLRAIETQEIHPLGARQPQRVDVRVLAATDADLEAAVAHRAFRGPLFHRLAGYQLQVPPLRARRDDIARLLVHFLRQECTAWGVDEPEPNSAGWMASALAARFVLYDWPGNARELRNVVRALLVARSGRLPLTLDENARRLLPLGAALTTRLAVTPKHAPAALDEAHVVEVLSRHHWSTTATAAELGISRTSLYALIERSKNIRKAADLSREELNHALSECGGDMEAAAERLRVSPRGLKLRLRQLR